MDKETFTEILKGFKADQDKGWAGYMTLSLSVAEAQDSLGFIETSKIMKQEFGE